MTISTVVYHINSKRKGNKMKTLTLIVLSFVLGANVTAAQEVPEPKNIMVGKAMFCDNENDLQTLLSVISLNNGEFPEELPATCGQFVPRTPVPMVVTPVYWYDTPIANSLVARFVFEPNGWTQYGCVAYIINPDYVTSSTDESL